MRGNKGYYVFTPRSPGCDTKGVLFHLFEEYIWLQDGKPDSSSYFFFSYKDGRTGPRALTLSLSFFSEASQAHTLTNLLKKKDSLNLIFYRDSSGATPPEVKSWPFFFSFLIG